MNPKFLLLGSLLILLLTGCASLPVVGHDAGPHTCPHPGVIWSRWQDQSIGTLVKQTRTRGCRHCGWAQVQSRFPAGAGATP